jgi:hypothetical protein
MWVSMLMAQPKACSIYEDLAKDEEHIEVVFNANSC